VHWDDQIIRSTRSLALASRLLKPVETQVRRGLAQARERAAGLYKKAAESEDRSADGSAAAEGLCTGRDQP